MYQFEVIFRKDNRTIKLINPPQTAIKVVQEVIQEDFTLGIMLAELAPCNRPDFTKTYESIRLIEEKMFIKVTTMLIWHK